jgi:AcrR family transcriptional regulator
MTPRRAATGPKRPGAARPRLGRPPAADSAETRLRILEVARETFADFGFAGATNRFIATKAGITTAALYHYFPSKLALYAAVYGAAQETVSADFIAGIESAAGLVNQFTAVLERAHALNASEPSLARFLSAARVDIGRHDDLRAELAQSSRESLEFIDRMVDDAIEAGEIHREQRRAVNLLIRTILIGLADGVSASLRDQRKAIDAILALLNGSLIEKK